MKIKIKIVFALTVLLSCCTHAYSQKKIKRGEITFSPCAGMEDLNAWCGSVDVPENPDIENSRSITMALALIPAMGKAVSDPIFLIQGGPGAGSINLAFHLRKGNSFENTIGILRDNRDFYFLDQRGTAGSGYLSCRQSELMSVNDIVKEDFLPVGKLKGCFKKLSKNHDLNQYGTADAADDLSIVISKLGLNKVNLAGYSYGTRVAQVFAVRHPEQLRANILFGVAPWKKYISEHLAKDSQNILDLILKDCEADTICNKYYPDVVKNLDDILNLFINGPISLKYKHPSNKKIRIQLSKYVFAESLRRLTYTSIDSVTIPWMINEIKGGNWQPMLDLIVSARRRMINMPEAMYLGVTCREDIAYIDLDKAIDNAKGTYISDYRAVNQYAACQEWPLSLAGELGNDLPSISIPTLMLNGSQDPATTMQDARDALTYHQNAKLIEIPFGAHSPFGLLNTSCIGKIQKSFIKTASLDNLPVSCLTTIKRPGWKLPEHSEETMTN